MDGKKKEKKRLRILPEVLPDPTARAADGGPRQRTLANMQRLLALAAASAALQTGCVDDADPVAAPPPARCPTAQPATATATAGTPSGSGSADAVSVGVPGGSADGGSVDAATTAHPYGGRGFGVVDPMPWPHRVPSSSEDKK